jgi:hypothetical protein
VGKRGSEGPVCVCVSCGFGSYSQRVGCLLFCLFEWGVSYSGHILPSRTHPDLFHCCVGVVPWCFFRAVCSTPPALAPQVPPSRVPTLTLASIPLGLA